MFLPEIGLSVADGDSRAISKHMKMIRRVNTGYYFHPTCKWVKKHGRNFPHINIRRISKKVKPVFTDVVEPDPGQYFKEVLGTSAAVA